MQTTASAPAAASSPTPAPMLGLFWLVAGALLLGEYLLISFIFDAGAWMAVEGPLRILGHLGELATIGAVAVFGTFLLRGRVILDALHALHRPQALSRRLLWAFAHLLSYALFVVATSQLFAVADPARVTALGLTLWLLAAVLSVLTLLLVLTPWQGLVALAPRVAPALGIGLFAGTAAFGFGQLSAALWGPMGRATLIAVYAVLRQLEDGVHVDYPSYAIGTETFVVMVAPVCSGFEGIGLIVVFLGGYIWLNRSELRFPNALWLVPLAMVTVWVANVLRIAALIVIGSRGSPEVALGGFHSKAGWVFFCVIALGFCLWMRSADTFRAHRSADEREDEHAEARAIAAAYLLPELALIAAMLITGLFVHIVDWLYGVRIVAALAMVWVMRARLRPLFVRPGWEGFAIGVAVFALWYVLTEHHSEAGDALRAEVMGAEPPLAMLWIALRVLGSVLVIPLCEELAFRGYLLRRVIDLDFDTVPFRKLTWPALLISSLAFGFLHGDWLAATIAGAAFAFAQWRHGRLIDAVVAHGVTNALVAVDVLVLGAWAQW